MSIRDGLGVEILLGDTVMVSGWGLGARLNDTGIKRKVLHVAVSRVEIVDSDGLPRRVGGREVQVLRRDGLPGFEGNR